MSHTQPDIPAIYGRVSGERQAEAGTIDSQIEDLRQRVRQDQLHLDEDLCFIDDGYSGSTLNRPALDRLRDQVAAGSIDRLYVHSPDRLARKYAYQVLLIDEFQRHGVEVVFLNRSLGESPEDQLLLQVQGVVAEYERAKLMERCRRGKLHTARQGCVNALAAAPYGYRYIRKADGGGVARFDVVLEEARVARQIFEWVGCERISLGAVGRRLKAQGIRTKRGRENWDRKTILDMLRNPAYKGTAIYGRTQVGPPRPRLRPQRGQAEQPRRPVSIYEVEGPGISIPVPALVSEDLLPPWPNSWRRTANGSASRRVEPVGSCKGFWSADTAGMRCTVWGRATSWRAVSRLYIRTIGASVATGIASVGSASATTPRFALTTWTRPSGRMSVNSYETPASFRRNTSGALTMNRAHSRPLWRSSWGDKSRRFSRGWPG